MYVVGVLLLEIQEEGQGIHMGPISHHFVSLTSVRLKKISIYEHDVQHMKFLVVKK